jgi:hypothetical protein
VLSRLRLHLYLRLRPYLHLLSQSNRRSPPTTPAPPVPRRDQVFDRLLSRTDR